MMAYCGVIQQKEDGYIEKGDDLIEEIENN